MHTSRLFLPSVFLLSATVALLGASGCGEDGSADSSPSGLAGKSNKGGKGGKGGTGGSSGAGHAGSGTGNSGGANIGGNKGGSSQGGNEQGGAGSGGSTTAGSGGNEQGGAGSGGSTTAGQGGSEQGGQMQGGSAGVGSGCPGDPNVDNDGDGYSEAEGDCNDCDPNANPGAVDIITYNPDGTVAEQQVDEDCDGSPTLPGQDTCDQNLAIDDNDPIKGAFAMDLCKISQNGSWGILKAEYVKIDGTPLPPEGHIGHGLLSKFGATTSPKRGARMFAVSSGTARAFDDPGFHDPWNYNQGTDSDSPPGFPLESPSCPGVITGMPHDAVALRLTIKAPTNAKSFSFKFKFYTYEYPGFICSTYNDFFTVLMDPPPVDVNPINKNITFDSQKNPVSVNNAFLEVCEPGTHGGKTFTCPGGTADLQGTGFEPGGATLWLQTQANVVSGSTFTLTFGAYDSGDHILDSTGLVDDFQWSATPIDGGTSTGKP